MSIKVDWGNAEDTLLIWRFHKDWTSRDLQDACLAAKNTLSQLNYEVDFIFDFGYSLSPPPNIIPLMRSLLLRCPANVRTVIVLGRTGFWEQIFSLVLKMEKFEYPIHFVRDVDAAYELIEGYI